MVTSYNGDCVSVEAALVQRSGQLNFAHCVDGKHSVVISRLDTVGNMAIQAYTPQTTKNV